MDANHPSGSEFDLGSLKLSVKRPNTGRMRLFGLPLQVGCQDTKFLYFGIL